MNSYYSIKHTLKLARWHARRAAAALKWGPRKLRRAPVVLGNAMPKSGSHLIIQVLQGLTQIGPFVNPGFPPVNRTEDNRKLSDLDVLKAIQRMRPGDIGYGYVGAWEPFLSELSSHARATVFIYRDPRDMIVSHVFYATSMHPGHWMREYYTQTLKTMEERINAAIQGVDTPGTELTPVSDRYAGYLGWLVQPGVLSLRFEDLVLDREKALGCLFDYLVERGFQPEISRLQAIKILGTSITPKRSGTFRKGQPGNWRQHFTEANKAVFKELTGDLLVRLGYEQDGSW